ncbi:MAG: glycosyltransferase family 4 protein [Clostridia bacterium]|nr:glycosyltransferase family 4 protein [Clostridia bacterium]
MKKICFVTTVSITLKSFVLHIAEHLNKVGGYDITFICNDDEEFRKSLPPYIRFIPVPMNRGINFRDLKSIIKLKKIFTEEKFDYIQYSTPNASLFASVAAKLAKAPIRVYAQWGIRYVSEQGLKRKFLKMLEKFTCHMSTHVRPQSEKNMEYAICEGLYGSDKASVIGTAGIDFNIFDISKKEIYRETIHREYNINSSSYIFGFVGRICVDKGSGELLKSFYKLLEKGYNAKLFMVGDAENIEDIDDELIDWAKESKDVIFTGHIDNSMLNRYYAAFDCYVHPTYREGFGIVLQEAAAMGNAIITTDVPGASEVMEKDVSCKLVLPQNTDKLEEAMEYVLNNRNESEKMGQKAYERTKMLYERRIMLESIEKGMIEIMEE